MVRCLSASMFFFFSSRRRHTRSLCDWSSDVCSSDLAARRRQARGGPPAPDAVRRPHEAGRAARSEERRVGKECRSRRAPDHEKKKNVSHNPVQLLRRKTTKHKPPTQPPPPT